MNLKSALQHWKGINMASIDTRLTALEKREMKMPIVNRFICKGSTPTKDEQVKIDDASKLGLVIIRTIISP